MPRSSIRRTPTGAAFLAIVGALAVLVAACGNPTDPSPSQDVPATGGVPATAAAPTPATTTAGTATDAPATAACAAIDLRAEGGPWGSAAGSRFAEVSVANQGGVDCMLPSRPVAVVTDSSGAVLVASDPAGESAGPVLGAGAAMTFTIQFGNWCDSAAALPGRTLLGVGAEGVEIGGLTLPTLDDLPPCNGPDQPPTLETTDWAPA